ncbi:unnamed protein product [Rotaria sordida]|uniref:Eukaryotic translation initiation factor 3 30 kDa subunit n=1 Tax=Rotaria sordida TaxID=392033 RepID=A0A818JCH6_9BILA|nr:unnamed protein product [Rotaria sordida]CAF1216736.1 unnamed protein product [Rotaria sordida]CAF3538079.1 unnamed protein product [Rotaria sordida]CAF3806600.1 unnamed protein product [Rotaria sordida]
MTDHWQDNSIASAEVKGDDEIPEDWEAELEEKPKKPVVEEKPKESTKTVSTAKHKTNRKKLNDNEESNKILIKEPDGDYTPEELDEIQKKGELQKEQDKLNMASELVENNDEYHTLDDFNLLTKEEFLNYSFRLHNRLETLSKSEFYTEFIDHFLNGITKSMSIENIKHLQATLQAIYLRKQSEEREKKAKSKTKKQNKPKLTTGRRADYGAFGVEGDQDYDQDNDFDDEDFM